MAESSLHTNDVDGVKGVNNVNGVNDVNGVNSIDGVNGTNGLDRPQRRRIVVVGLGMVAMSFMYVCVL